MSKNRSFEIHFSVIFFIILIVIGSAKIISLAMEEKQEINQVAETTNIIEQNSTNENIIVSNNNVVTNNVIEEKVEEKETEVIKKDTKALAQINTTSRKTTSGRKYTSIGLINIPSLNIKYQILSSTSEELLKISVNKYWGPSPNEVGNLCILGHNYKDSRFFGNLPKIKKGAKILITDLEGRTLTYKVYETDIIKEDDVSCTSQQTNRNKEVTLITCYYEPGCRKATKRFIAKARAE